MTEVKSEQPTLLVYEGTLSDCGARLCGHLEDMLFMYM